MADGLLARRALALGITSVLVGGGVPVLAHAALAGGGPGAASATAADTTAPALVSTNPADKGSVKPTVGAISATYDEALDPTKSALALFDSSGDPVMGNSSLSADGKTVKFDPTEPLSGSYKAVATVADAAGNGTTTTFTFKVDGTAPAAPSVQAPPYTRNTLSVQGTGEAGATVDATVSDGTSTLSGTTTVLQDGSYAINVDVGSLDQGTLTVSATQTDAAGNTGPAGSDTTVRDTVAPDAPSITAVTPDPIGKASASSVKVTGTAPTDAASVNLVVTDSTGGKTGQLTTSVASDGSYTFTGVDVSGLAEGALTFSVRATDQAGNNSTASSKQAQKSTGSPVVSDLSVTPAKINAASQDNVVVKGSKPAGSSVKVVVSDGAGHTVTVVVPADSATTFATEPFSVRRTSSSGLDDGALNVAATATSASGDSGATAMKATSKDTVAPVAPSVIAGNANSANQAVYLVKGVTEAGASVLVSVDDDGDTTTDPVTKTVVADSDGNYSATLDISSLDDAAITVKATASDSFGNPASTSVMRTKDTMAPGKPTATLNPDPIKDPKAATVTGSVATADTAQYSRLKVTVTVTDGMTVTNPVTVVPESSGAYSAPVDVSALSDGTLTATAVVQDQAGNSSSGATDDATKDTVALMFVSSQPAQNGTVRSAGLVSATYNEVLNKASSTVQVRNTNGTLVSGTTRFSSDGKTIIFNASQAFSNAGSPYTATFNVADRTTETDPNRKITFTVDPQAPPSVVVPQKVDATNQDSYVVMGLAEQGATLAITVTDKNGTKISKTAAAASDGSYKTAPFSVASLADGVLTASVVATYSDGVTSKPGTATSTKGTVPTDLVAVTGTNGAAYVRTTPGGFSNLGGALKSAPSIVQSGSDTYYFAIGSNDNVYVGAKGKPFRALGPSGTVCQNVSAALLNGTIAVACRGSNGALYVAKTSAPAGQLPPPVTRFTNLGGTSLTGTGPSVSTPNGAFQYTVVGTDHVAYKRTDSASFSRVSGAPTCYGPAAVATDGTLLACANSSGGLQARQNGTTTYTTLPGSVRGRVGTAVDPDGATRYYVVFSNNAVKVATQNSAGAFSPFAASTGTVSTAGAFAVSLTK